MLNLFFHALALERTDSISLDLQNSACRALCMEYDSCFEELKRCAPPDSHSAIYDYQGYTDLDRSCALVAHYKVGFFSGLMFHQSGYDTLPVDGETADCMIEMLCKSNRKECLEFETTRRLYALIPNANLLKRMNLLQMEIQIIMQDACLREGRKDGGEYAGIIDLNRLSATELRMTAACHYPLLYIKI